MASVTIELNRQFDPGRWQIAGRRAEGGPTLLMTWELETDPVDAGIPPQVQTVLAEALCSLGFCCFAGDPGSGTSIGPLTVRRGISRRRTEVFRAERATDLLSAFDSGAHDWSMAAQWIIVSAPDTGAETAHQSRDHVLRLVACRLLREYVGNLPAKHGLVLYDHNKTWLVFPSRRGHHQPPQDNGGSCGDDG